jgi:hypothetical protein
VQRRQGRGLDLAWLADATCCKRCADQLSLSETDVRHSAAVLREFGNLSSPTVFFVLERALADRCTGWALVDVLVRCGLQLPRRVTRSEGKVKAESRKKPSE